MPNHFNWRSIDANYASVYDDFRGGYAPQSIHHILQRANITSRSSVILDLACGTGAVLREMFSEAHLLIGMDAAGPMLKQVQTRYSDQESGLCLACANGEQLPLATDCIDLVTIGQAIHWFNLPTLLAGLRRVLCPGGWLAVLSRYPSPAGRLQALVEQLRYPFTEEGRQGIPVWSTMSAPSNLLGLERAGFVDYERAVFQHEMELTISGYLRGMVDRNKRHALTPEDLAVFSAALEEELKITAPGGGFREVFFDYVFMARKAQNPG